MSSESPVVIDAAERGLRAGFFDRRAQRANHAVDGPSRSFGRVVIEIDDGVFGFRMGRERATRECDHAGDAWIGEGLGEGRLAHEAGGTDERRDFMAHSRTATTGIH